MAVLVNYVMLQNNVPAKLHFTDHIIEPRTITDPRTGQGATRNMLVFEVDRLDGSAVNAKYSTMSEKHANQFAAYLNDKSYRNFDFIITQSGEGFRRSWTLLTMPHTS